MRPASDSPYFFCRCAEPELSLTMKEHSRIIFEVCEDGAIIDINENEDYNVTQCMI